MQLDSCLKINGRKISVDQPTYFIADIAANHDGDIDRAIDLINLAKAAGADAAKFQHFRAETIVSDEGFRALGGNLSHQSKWKKSVFEVYRDASVSLEWTGALKQACDKVGITFFTSPYSLDLVDAVDPYVPAYKVGSGDITWLEIIEYIARLGKPYIIATGASTTDDVWRAVEVGLRHNSQLAIMQCNTNYTANIENLRYVNLNVLKTYREMFPGAVLGLSDHTKGLATVMGAVALGARIVEKHFTDDRNRTGPDHAFSMDPAAWREMVDRVRELEGSLGSGVKKVEDNERETVVLQRRSVRAAKILPELSVVERGSLAILRPCPRDAVPAHEVNAVVGRKLRRSVQKGEYLRWNDFV
jgi:N-acetylneuraminate synthase